MYKSDKENPQHLRNIVCSFGVTLSLTVLIYYVLQRILKRDLSSNHHSVMKSEEEDDDMGWK